MTWQTHITFSLAFTAWLSSFLGFLIGPFSLILAGFASLVPDIDAARSKFGGMIGSQKGCGKHRGIFHSLLFVVILSIIAFVLHNLYGGGMLYLAFILGYLSHILIDGFTEMGVPLLYPWKQYINFLPKSISFRTGKIEKSVLFILFAAVFIVWLVLNFSNLDTDTFIINNLIYYEKNI